MSKLFNAYAAYYDALYTQKDYAQEAAYVDRIIRKHLPSASKLLELGSGTGGHAVHLAQLGYAVHGIDLSSSMVSLAQSRDTAPNSPKPSFEIADLRTYRAGQRFDAVASLFHVISYQVHDDDVRQAMATAVAHLEQGGVFIFDCWYGPGVLMEPPGARTRTFSSDGTSITRHAHPDHNPQARRVDVHYKIEVRRGDACECFHEVHPMRYFFLDEIDAFLDQAGLNRVWASAWKQDDLGNGAPWYACFAATL